MKPRSPIKSVGRRTVAKRAQRRAVVEEVLERDRGCVFMNHVLAVYGNDYVPFEYPYNCRPPLDCHEIIPRSVWPNGELEPTNCTMLCRTHHEFVTDHPADAYALGLHSFSWERPR